MNAEVYLFGKSTQDQYFQYPQNYTQSVFQSFQQNVKGKTQLFIRRSGSDLVYYGYIRKIGNSENQYIGLCFVLNSILITDEKALFQIFESMVGNLIKNNRLVELDVQGVLVSKSFTAKDLQKEFDSFRLNIQLELDVLDYTNSYLPPLNNNISSSDIQYYTLGKDDIDIQEAFSTCDFIVISKNTDFNTGFLLKFKQHITTWREREKDANKKYNDLVDEHSQLANEYAKLRREKKQTVFVAILVFCLLFGLLVGITVLNEKEQMVSQKNQQIRYQEDVISTKDESIKDKDLNIATLKIKNESLRTDVEYLNGKIMEKDIIINSLYIKTDSLKRLQADYVKKYSYNNSSRNSYEKKTTDSNYSSSYSSSSSYNSNTYSKDNSYEKATEDDFVRVENGTPMWENLNSVRKVKTISDNEKVYIIREVSSKYYYVRVGNDYGYISKLWVVK